MLKTSQTLDKDNVNRSFLSKTATGVQQALGGVNFAGPITSPLFTGALTGNASSATKLETSRTITLGGDASGSVGFDGTANVTLTVTVADDSHNHIISNVDGLQAALDLKANLASPTLTGTPAAPTAAVNTNTTQIATTAFVLAQSGTASPKMDGTATVGTATRFAREDHIHPIDTSRAPVASPTFTGTVTTPALVSNTVDIKSSSTASKFTLDFNETEKSLDFIYTP